MLCLPQVGAFPLLLPYPCWLSHSLCNWHCSGLAMPSVPSPKENWLPHSDQSLCYAACIPSTPSPGSPPTTAWLLSITSTSGPPRYPCSICSLEVGKDSLKCSTAPSGCTSPAPLWPGLTFAKSARLAPPWVWIALLVSVGILLLPPTSQRHPAPLSPALPPPTTSPLTCSDLMDSSLPLPSHPPLLNTYPPSAFTLPVLSPPPTSSQPIHNLPPHPQRNSRFSHNLRILQWNAGGLSSSRRAELIAFLSGNQYDLIFLQETHLSSTKKFQIRSYYTLRTDRTFGRQGSVSGGYS